MRPRIWTVFAAYVLLGALTQSAVTTAGLTWAWWQTGERYWLELLRVAATFEQTPGSFVLCRLPAHLVLLVATGLLGWQSPAPLGDRLGLRSCGWSGRQLMLVFGASAAPLMLSIAISTWFVPEDASAAFYEQFTGWTATAYLAYMMLLPGIVEELFFRGYIQRRLLQRWSPVTAIILTAVLFTVAHGVTPPVLLTVLPVGVWLGWIAWRADSIWPGCVCHAAFNAIWCGWPMLRYHTSWADGMAFLLVCVTALCGATCLGVVLPWLCASPCYDDLEKVSTAAKCGKKMHFRALGHRRSQALLGHPSGDRDH